MAVEFDSHHVVNLALVPIRGRPDIGNGIDRADVFGDMEFQSYIDSRRHRIKFVNDLETWFFAEIVDARDIDQIIERELVAAEFCDFMQIAGRDRVSGFTAELSRSEERRVGKECSW